VADGVQGEEILRTINLVGIGGMSAGWGFIIRPYKPHTRAVQQSHQLYNLTNYVSPCHSVSLLIAAELIKIFPEDSSLLSCSAV
jgi:hypothetical protein